MTTLTLSEAARKAAIQTKAGRTLTGEDIRLRCKKMGVTAPTPTAWGGVIQSMIRSGILENSGKSARMNSPQARGRRSPVYIRNSVR